MEGSRPIAGSPDEGRSRKPVSGETATLLPLILGKIIHTKESRRLIGALAPEMMNLWAGSTPGKTDIKGYLKTKVSTVVGKHIQTAVLEQAEMQRAESLSALVDDPGFSQMLLTQIPGLSDALLEALVSIGRNIEALPVHEKMELLENLVSITGEGRTGEIFTLLGRTINDIHESDPEFFTSLARPGVRKWLEKADFGEVRDLIDGSRADISAFIKMLNDEIWMYPAKVVLVLAAIPDGLSVLIELITESLRKFNNVSPDLVTDIVLSLVRRIDGASLGLLLNEFSELVRKLHTGSALIGDPGAPLFPNDLGQLAEDMTGTLDADLFWKALVAIAEDKEAVQKVTSDIFSDHPEIFKRKLQYLPQLINTRIRSKGSRMSAVETLLDDDMIDVFENSMSDLDAQEMAEVVNFLTLAVNRIQDMKPELVPVLMAQFVDALDLDELRESVRGTAAACADSLLPAARAVVPGLVSGLCRVLSPADDEFEEDAQKARDALRALLLTGEVQP